MTHSSRQLRTLPGECTLWNDWSADQFKIEPAQLPVQCPAIRADSSARLDQARPSSFLCCGNLQGILHDSGILPRWASILNATTRQNVMLGTCIRAKALTGLCQCCRHLMLACLHRTAQSFCRCPQQQQPGGVGMARSDTRISNSRRRLHSSTMPWPSRIQLPGAFLMQIRMQMSCPIRSVLGEPVHSGLKRKTLFSFHGPSTSCEFQ